MDEKRMVKISRYLSKHLRHTPERIGLTLMPGGWVRVDDLMAACARNQMIFSRDDLTQVVANNDKQRFAFDETGTLIRANQGHSVEVDLELPPAEPPLVLYHGTGAQFVESILEKGLLKMSRQHVHLSKDVATAIKVGSRHGRPVVLQVDSGAMHTDGNLFYLSANGVWLTDQVPPKYLRPLDQ